MSSESLVRQLLRVPGPRLELVLVVGCIALWLGLLLPSLTRFPPLNNDEGREANLYWVASGIEPGAARINAYRISPTWGTGGLQGATAAVIFRIFDTLGSTATLIFQARLTSLLWGGLLLLATYWIGRSYWNRRVGLIAMVLLAVSNPFMLGTHTLRPDIQIVTLVLVALALVEHGIECNLRWPFILAGVLLALSWDTHMNTVALAAFVPATLLVREDPSFWRRSTLQFILLGGLIGMIYYAAVRIVPDPQGFFEAAGYWIGINKKPPGLGEGGAGPLAPLLNELLRYADYFGVSSSGVEEWPELVLLLAGLVLACRRAVRGSCPDRILLLGLIAMAAVFVAAVRMKSQYYMLLTYPFWTLLVAQALVDSIGRLRRDGTRRMVLACAVLLVVVWPMKFHERVWDKYVRGVRYRSGQEYYQLAAQLHQIAGPGAKILAPPVYWIGLKDHQFVDIFVYERVKRQYGETPAAFLDTIRPDIVITDAKIATERATERELYRALDERAPYELIVRHKNYGDVAIYRLKRP